MRPVYWCGACGLLVAPLGCTFPSASAPDGARVTLAFPNGNTVFADSARRVSAVLRLETGDGAGAKWRIDFVVARGELSTGTEARSVALRGRTDANGVVGLLFHAPRDTGWVRITASTTEREAVDSIHVLAAPPKPTQVR